MNPGPGLSDDDRPTAGSSSRTERIESIFRVPLFAAAVLAIPVLAIGESNLGQPWQGIATVLDWAIWSAFAAHLAVGLAVLPNRRRWLLDHPLEVLVVVLTPPFLPSTLKVARVLPILRLIWLVVLAGRVRTLFSTRGLRYVALVAFAIVLVGGTLFPLVEREQDLSTWDGLWWATETVTTVAYGDIYPETAWGRVVAAVVMTTGIGFVALLTGSLAQRFLQGTGEGRNDDSAPTDTEILEKIDDMTDEIARFRKVLQERRGSDAT